MKDQSGQALWFRSQGPGGFAGGAAGKNRAAARRRRAERRAGETAKWDEAGEARVEIGIQMNIENRTREEEPETRFHTEN